MGNVRILIVEDETIVAKDIQKRLKQMGYVVAGLADTGEEAIRRVEAERPDLVLMDIMLKGRLDGIEAARQIGERFFIPVIYLTAYSDDNTLKRAEATQPFSYILKPFEERELQIAIQMALYKHKMEKRLKDSAEWFATTLRCISDGVITVDQGGKITFMNPVAEDLTGWKRKEAAGRELGEVFRTIHEETRVELESAVMKALREGVVVSISDRVLLIGKDRAETPIEQSAAPIRGERSKVLGVVLVFGDVTHRREQVAAREYQTLHDGLTGLPNRSLFYDRLQQAVLVGHRTKNPLALLFIVLDRFREINQTKGRYTGDLLLQQVGQRLWDALRRSDTVARMGGEEFALVLPGVGLVDHAALIAEKILRVMEEPFIQEGQRLSVKVHMGCALFPRHSEDPDTLVHQAYEAMETAQEKGKNYVIYPTSTERPKKHKARRLLSRRSKSSSK